MKPAFEFFGFSLSSSEGNRSDDPGAEASGLLNLFGHSHPVKAAAFM